MATQTLADLLIWTRDAVQTARDLGVPLNEVPVQIVCHSGGCLNDSEFIPCSRIGVSESDNPAVFMHFHGTPEQED